MVPIETFYLKSVKNLLLKTEEMNNISFNLTLKWVVAANLNQENYLFTVPENLILCDPKQYLGMVVLKICLCLISSDGDGFFLIYIFSLLLYIQDNLLSFCFHIGKTFCSLGGRPRITFNAESFFLLFHIILTFFSFQLSYNIPLRIIFYYTQ